MHMSNSCSCKVEHEVVNHTNQYKNELYQQIQQITLLDLAEQDGLLCLSLENGRNDPPVLYLELENRFEFVGENCSWPDLS